MPARMINQQTASGQAGPRRDSTCGGVDPENSIRPVLIEGGINEVGVHSQSRTSTNAKVPDHVAIGVPLAQFLVALRPVGRLVNGSLASVATLLTPAQNASLPDSFTHFADLAVVHDLGLADDGPPLVLVGGQQRAKVVPAIPLKCDRAGRLGRLLEQCPDDLLAVVNPDAEVAVKGHRDRADHLRQFQGGCVVDRQHSDGESSQICAVNGAIKNSHINHSRARGAGGPALKCKFMVVMPAGL